MMKKVVVTVYEVHAVDYMVEVDDENIDPLYYDSEIHQKAVEKANELIEIGNQPVSIDYSHTIDPEKWTSFVLDN